jgi:hypothetical protein
VKYIDCQDHARAGQYAHARYQPRADTEKREFLAFFDKVLSYPRLLPGQLHRPGFLLCVIILDIAVVWSFGIGVVLREGLADVVRVSENEIQIIRPAGVPGDN